ncbi:DUF2815 family protein [Peptococcus simiae]|uniref:DUF2815 family protein n=1 Tax=Peptococcus simiae TaxID=1643805 RepID=UPI0039806F45
MSNATKNPVKVCITGRLSYAAIFEPTSFEGQEPRYSTAILIPKDDKKTLDIINAAVKAATEEGKTKYWKGKVPVMRYPVLRDGDAEKPDDENYAGHYWVNAKSKNPPQVVLRYRDPETGKGAKATEMDVYSGCWANVMVTFYPYDTAGNRGIGANLGNIQKVKDGERLGGGSTAEDDFNFEEEVLDDDDFLS